ncbi:MAG: sensor histidine kinase [Caldilineaceae bacterium]|nr:sensor histidine kinase [Caldilineaceae bacterium]MCB0095752.1 sensor histidine kinase [Caldilineaceae bacterium]
MDSQIKNCPDLAERDIDLLYKVESGLAIVADVSRADVLLCARLSANNALVLRHVEPKSISSLYRQNATGRLLSAEEQPLLHNTLRHGVEGRTQRQVLRSGAPVIQHIRPIRNAVDKVIGALAIETNMIEHERHRRRDRRFRQAVRWLQVMGAHGEIENPDALRRFGPYDGIYLVSRDRQIVYMSGIVTNLFRSIGRQTDMRGKDVSELEDADALIVDQAFDAHRCVESRHETEDGRIWIRGAIPLRTPPTDWRNSWLAAPLRPLWNSGKSSSYHPSNNSGQTIDAGFVLVHNATDTVQRERELNVKSAIIQEVHHRVKNNLQTIAAVLRIQARRTQSDETRQQISEAVNRILSMSVIHEFLSQDEHRPINVRDVCQRIVNQVKQVAIGPEQQVEISVHGPTVRLPAAQATPTAMVVNELLLNAMEHGVGDRTHGHIQIHLDDLGNAVRIAVLDDGKGLPSDFDPNMSTSLGLQIVHTLVTDDLKGQLQIEPIPATPPVATAEAPDVQPDGAPAAQPEPLPYFTTQVVVTFPKRPLTVE